MEIEPAKKRKVGGQPIPDDVCEIALQRMEDGEGPYAVAADLGWNPMSLSRAIRRDPGRAERYLTAHRDAAMIAAQRADELADEAETAWRTCAARGEPSLLNSALNHWSNVAKRRDPRMWGDKQSVEVSGGVTISRGPDLSALNQQQLEALAAIPDADSKVP
jgi:hypothetical protein